MLRMELMMNPIKINIDKFKLGLIISFAITSIYPIGLFISMPASEALTILKHELSWSLFALFFIPVGFGLMCSIISVDIISKLNYIYRIIFFVLPESGLLVLLLVAVAPQFLNKLGLNSVTIKCPKFGSI